MTINQPEQDAKAVTADGMSFLNREFPVTCPTCGQTLQVATLDDHKVAGCEKCHGILLQTPAFAEIVKQRRTDFVGKESVRGTLDEKQMEICRDCPACGDPMDTHPYYGPGNVVIDSCAPCGLVWLDRSELFEIIRAPGIRDRVV